MLQALHACDTAYRDETVSSPVRALRVSSDRSPSPGRRMRFVLQPAAFRGAAGHQPGAGTTIASGGDAPRPTPNALPLNMLLVRIE